MPFIIIFLSIATTALNHVKAEEGVELYHKAIVNRHSSFMDHSKKTSKMCRKNLDSNLKKFMCDDAVVPLITSPTEKSRLYFILEREDDTSRNELVDTTLLLVSRFLSLKKGENDTLPLHAQTIILSRVALIPKKQRINRVSQIMALLSTSKTYTAREYCDFLYTQLETYQSITE